MTRLYFHGYGRDIRAFIECPQNLTDLSALDGLRLNVRSAWRSQHAGLRAKGVKHALLWDLYRVGFLRVMPPADWRQVRLADPQPKPPAPIDDAIIADFRWPDFVPRAT